MNENELYFKMLLEEEKKKYLEKATEETEKKLKEKVQTNVYDSYSPKNYTRTNQLKNKVKGTVENDVGEVTWENMDYINNEGNQVGDNIPTWINSGYKHKSWDKGVDYYHERPSSNFIEDTIIEIKEEFEDIKVTKID